MAGRTIAELCERYGSNKGKSLTCARPNCKADIPEYAGRRVAAYRDLFVHQPGRCADQATREATTRSLADQPGLFAWSCAHVEPAGDLPLFCNEASDDRDAYAAHMKAHGATQLRPAVAPIKLRKSSKPPAPKFADVDMASVFKRVTWTTTTHVPDGEYWPAEQGGGPKYTEVRTGHAGQFWSAGEAAHSIWVVEDMRASGQPNRWVQLYAHGDGTWSADWSRAKWDRRDANRKARSAA